MFPWLGCDIAEIEACDAVLVAGSRLRKEAPILAHRIRKAALAGAKVAFANPDSDDYLFNVASDMHGADLVDLLAGIAVAAAAGKSLPEAVGSLCKGVKPNADQKATATLLAESGNGIVLIGNAAIRHPAYSSVRALASAIAELCGSRFGVISEGPNAAGAHLAGLLPHRSAGGKTRATTGLNAAEMLDASMDAMLLFGVEPARDIAGPNATERLSSAGFVAAFTAYDSEDLRQAADVMLPIGTFAETSGTFVNCEGRWQSFAGIANPLGECRPGWKVLRVLGNLLDIPEFDYQSSEEIRDELAKVIGEVKPDNRRKGSIALSRTDRNVKSNGAVDVPIYGGDAVVRRATALQLTPEARRTAPRGPHQ
jgi:NADH-quinone oxidoreductase subunit G